MVNLPVNDNALALHLRSYDIEAGSVKPHPQERLPPRHDFAVELDRVDRRAHSMSFHPAGYAVGEYAFPSIRLSYTEPLKRTRSPFLYAS